MSAPKYRVDPDLDIYISRIIYICMLRKLWVDPALTHIYIGWTRHLQHIGAGYRSTGRAMRRLLLARMSKKQPKYGFCYTGIAKI